MKQFMEYFLEYVLNEKIVISFLMVFFASITVLLIKWRVDKEYIMLFGGFVTALSGALLRGITHVTTNNGGSAK